MKRLQDINELYALEPGDGIFIPRGDYEIEPNPKQGTSDEPLVYQYRIPAGVTIRGETDHNNKPLTRIIVPPNVVNRGADALTLFYGRKADGVSILDLEIIGEGRQLFDNSTGSWRGGAGTAFSFSDAIWIENVTARNFQTHFDFHECTHASLIDCKSRGTSIPAFFRFRESRWCNVNGFRGISDFDGYAHPGYDENPNTNPENRFGSHGMGGWIVHGSQKIQVIDYAAEGCKQEALVIEGRGIRDVDVTRIRLRRSRWGFVSRGMSNGLFTRLDIAECWRAGILLDGREDVIENNVFDRVSIRNCGRHDRTTGRDDWPAIKEWRRCKNNRFRNYTIDNRRPPWPAPKVEIDLQEA